MTTITQRRCFVTSFAIHGGLLGALILLAAFAPKTPPPPNQPYITIVPTSAPLTGDATHGSEMSGPKTGNEAPPLPVKPPTVVPQNPIKTPPPEPVAPPPKATPQARVVPPVVKPIDSQVKPQDTDPNRAASTKKIDVSHDLIKAPTVDRRKLELAKKAEREAEARERKAEADRIAKAEAWNRLERERLIQQRRNLLNDTLEGLGKSLAGSTKIELPGPGGGGENALNYADYVQQVFQAAWNRNRPATLAAKSAQSRVSLTIKRDGSFTYRVLTAARIGEVDGAIGRILSQQRRLNPFPADLKAEDLEIIITFNLESSVSG